MDDDTDLPTPSEIIEIHDEIEDEYGLKYTGISASLPERTLENILSDVAEQPDLYLRAAALCRRLISAHIFEDGNKRTAWTVTRLYLEQHGAEPAVKDPAQIAPILRNIQRFDTEELAEWLSTGDINDDALNR